MNSKNVVMINSILDITKKAKKKQAAVNFKSGCKGSC